MSSFFIPSLLMVSLAIEPLLMESLLMESLPIVSFLSWAKAGIAAKSNATVAAAAETTMASAPASAAAVNLVVIACPFGLCLSSVGEHVLCGFRTHTFYFAGGGGDVTCSRVCVDEGVRAHRIILRHSASSPVTIARLVRNGECR